MRHVRTLLVVAFGLTTLPHAIGQDSAASQPATRPATETGPASRPAEVRARHPRIGIRVDAVALEQQKIARVDAVTPGSPAERAGVKIGDVIVKVGGEEIRDDKTYREVMSRRRPGESVTIVVRRGGEETDLSVTLPERPVRKDPEQLTVQHVLIMCGDRPNPQGKKRTPEEAKKLAEEILLKAKNGADFGELVKSYSEDQGSITKDPPGSYMMVEDGKPKPPGDVRERSGMVAGFSSVAFSLDVGDVAMASYDPELSPYGFHIIKRIK